MKRLIITVMAVIMLLGTATACDKKKKDGVYMPEKGKVEIFQLMPENASLMMSYVIKTPNNKIVVFDGGRDGDGLDKDPYIISAIRAILGIGETDEFEIEAWFLTHEHRDHYYELAKCLNQYTEYSGYKINNFYFDFPEIGPEGEWDSRTGAGDYTPVQLNRLKKGFDKYYKALGEKAPDDAGYTYFYDKINGAVINTDSVEKGLDIEIDGLNFKILRTWSKKDLVVNSTSVITRITYGEHSMLVLGDSYVDSGDEILKKYGADALKSEYVQLAHHGQAGCSEAFYKAIDIENTIRLWPTPWWVWDVKGREHLVTNKTRSWAGLPEDSDEVTTIGTTDFVGGSYEKYPEEPTAVASWTRDVLNGMKVAVW